MAIGPVQLLVLGFAEPKFHGEILAELDRLKENDIVRVIDGLAVHKDAEGEVTVLKRTDLSDEEAAEFGATVGALIGLGIGGEEGAEVGAELGAERTEDGVDVFPEEDALDVIEEIPNDSASRDHPARAPLGDSAPGRRCAGERHADRGFVHPPAGSRRNRPDRRRGGGSAHALRVVKQGRIGSNTKGRTDVRTKPQSLTPHGAAHLTTRESTPECDV